MRRLFPLSFTLAIRAYGNQMLCSLVCLGCLLQSIVNFLSAAYNSIILHINFFKLELYYVKGQRKDQYHIGALLWFTSIANMTFQQLVICFNTCDQQPKRQTATCVLVLSPYYVSNQEEGTGTLMACGKSQAIRRISIGLHHLKADLL